MNSIQEYSFHTTIGGKKLIIILLQLVVFDEKIVNYHYTLKIITNNSKHDIANSFMRYDFVKF